MAVDVLLGLQWGDEGKGKIVDVLSPGFDLVTRFQGGPNAGHTLEFDHKKFVLNTVPSGIFFEKTMNLIGNGTVIDPVAFKKEITQLKDAGYDILLRRNLLISRKAHLILPTHALLDAAAEGQKYEDKIGSTLKGIGPCYTDKTGREGLRVGDICLPDFRARYQKLVRKHLNLLDTLYGRTISTAESDEIFFEGIELMKQFPFVDSEHTVNEYLRLGKKILAEGAQGTLLDIDFGSYPFVTSSSTVAAGACLGLGIGPGQIGEVIGICKAYSTRVGGGPFPTELKDSSGDELRRLGHEYGANTGRPRRTGWLDLPALKYAVMINGVTQLVLTKADVLSSMEKIMICTHYVYKHETIDYMPYDMDAVEPVYKEMEGWQSDLSTIKHDHEVPLQLMAYIKLLEKELQVPVKYLSVGPDRLQTLIIS